MTQYVKYQAITKQMILGVRAIPTYIVYRFCDMLCCSRWFHSDCIVMSILALSPGPSPPEGPGDEAMSILLHSG